MMFFHVLSTPQQREKIEAVQSKLKVKNHVFIRPVSSRWLSLENVINRLIEQLPAMNQYFLRTIKDDERKKNDRLQRICAGLKNPLLLVDLLFLKSVMPVFTRMTRFLQSEGPLIHLLHDEMYTLAVTVLRRFVKPEVMEDMTVMKLYDIKFMDTANHIKRPDFGQEALKVLTDLMEKKLISQLDKKTFLGRVLAFYQVTFKEILRTFPLKNKLLQDLSILHPLGRQHNSSAEAIKRIAVSLKVFPRNDIDVAADEWRAYQAEDIPEDWWRKRSEIDPSVGASDEEEEDYEEGTKLHYEVQAETYKYERIDSYWWRVMNMEKISGGTKYPSLGKLVKIALTLSHGNADVERGFSENKRIITDERTSLKISAVGALRTTSSYLTRFGRKPQNLPITKPLLKAVKNARSSYADRLERNRQALKRKREEVEALVTASKKKADANSLKKRAIELHTEGLNLLNEGCRKQDLSKMSAANAILQSAKKLEEEADKLKN